MLVVQYRHLTQVYKYWKASRTYGALVYMRATVTFTFSAADVKPGET